MDSFRAHSSVTIQFFFVVVVSLCFVFETVPLTSLEFSKWPKMTSQWPAENSLSLLSQQWDSKHVSLCRAVWMQAGILLPELFPKCLKLSVQKSFAFWKTLETFYTFYNIASRGDTLRGSSEALYHFLSHSIISPLPSFLFLTDRIL